MSIALLSLQAEESKELVDGVNRCYLKGPNITIFDGTEEHTIESGADGKSAFEVWVDNQPARQNPYTYEEYIAAITGPIGRDGINGIDGVDGKSAFEVWAEHQPVTTPPTEHTYEEYIASITGPKGDKGDKGDTGPQGPQGEQPKDSKGISWWEALIAIFGAGIDAAEIATAIYSINAIEAQIAALEAQLATNGILDLGDDALEAFDTVSDVTQGTTVFQRLVNAISSWFSRISAAIRGYSRVTTQVVSPYFGLEYL